MNNTTGLWVGFVLILTITVNYIQDYQISALQERLTSLEQKK